MRWNLLALLLLMTSCVARDADNRPVAGPVPGIAPLLPTTPADESELAYGSRAEVVRLLQEWGRQTGAARLSDNDTELVFSHVVVEEIRGQPGHFVAICDWNTQWWGVACCVKVSKGQIETLWVLEDQDEQSMRSVASEYVSGPNGPMSIIVAFGHTHMGHGSLYLYEYSDKGPRLILETPAVDSHMDEDLYRGGGLVPLFDDLSRDGRFEVTLLGVRQYYDGWADDVPPISSEVVQRVFVYDLETRVLVEDATRRIGKAHGYE